MAHHSVTSGYERDPRSCPSTKVQVQFVTVDPLGRENKAKTRAIVRANAAHYHWRHNRPPQTDDLKGKKASKTTVTRKSRARPKVSISQPQILATTCAKTPELEAYSRLREIPGTGRYQLGVDTLDPFASYVCDLPRGLVSRCITFNAQNILPNLFPDVPNGLEIISNMLQSAASHSSLLCIFMIGALLRAQGGFPVTADSPTSLSLFRCRAQIVRDVSIAVQDPVEACKDVNIFAVSSLANKGRSKEPELEIRRKRPNQGPLQTLQTLSYYATTTTDPVHAQGLEKMIELKGGLDKIEMPGLAHLVSSSGLRFATQDSSVPRYPVITLSCPSTEFVFYHQGPMLNITTDEDLYLTMSMLKSYTLMVDDHCHYRKRVLASVLIDHRNTAQHALLSLRPRTGSAECLRLASLIYSLLVVFPLPYIRETFERLVTQLRMALRQWDGDYKLLLWVIVMGGIGAVELDTDRQWYIGRLQNVLMQNGVGSWDETRKVLDEVLWYEDTNGKDGYDLWQQSQDFNRQGT